MLSFVLIIAIFKSGVVRDLPIVVLDNDRSELSAKLLRNIEASATMKIAYKVHSTKDALTLIQKRKAYALLIVPKHFEQEILLHKNPKLTAMINTQYILIGKILTAALNSVVMHSAAEVEYVQKLATLQESTRSLFAISPVGMQVTPFFNTYKNYFYFLVSALLPSLWQIFIVIATLVSLGEMFKYKREQTFFTDEHVGTRLLGLLLPYTIAYMLLGIGYTLYLYSMWEFQGSFGILFLGMFLTVVAYQAIALFLFTLGFDYARSLSLGAVYTAPAFAFLGITFPVYSMNGFSLFWRDILPIAHYTKLQIAEANYGVGLGSQIDTLLVLFLFWLLFIPVLLRFKNRLKKGK